MSSSSSSTMLGSSESSPTRTPQPDPTDDEPTVQEGANRAEHAENIANGAQDENVRLQEQIKQLKEFFKEKEQKLVEEKEAAEKAAHSAQEALGKAQTVAGEVQTEVSTATDGLRVAVRTARDEAQTAVRTVAGAQTAVRTATDAALRTVAGEAQTAVRTAIEQAQRDQETAKEQKLETRHKWFFWIMLALVANALLWISMLYEVFRIEDWGSQRPMYLARVWMIFTAPLLVVMMLLFSPCLSKFKDYVCHRYLEVEPWDFGILLINAAACFAFVVAYLYTSAIPRYHYPVFESGVDFADPLRWPTVAIISDSFDEQGLISVSPARCSIFDTTTLSGPGSECSPGALSHQESIFLENSIFVFNASLLSPENQTVHNLAVEILIVFEIIYNSSYSAPGWLIYTADSRMSLMNLVTCGFFNYQTSPMFTGVDISLTMENLHDELSFIGTTFAIPSEPDQYPPDCEPALRKLLSAQEPLYSLYTASITNSDSMTSYDRFSTQSGNCSAASEQYQCGFVDITLSFGSRIVRTTETKPGISKVDIWLNAGAIVGAIQFFAWLLRGG